MSDTLTALITDTFGGDTIAILLNKYDHGIQVTEEMLKAAASKEDPQSNGQPTAIHPKLWKKSRTSNETLRSLDLTNLAEVFVSR